MNVTTQYQVRFRGEMCSPTFLTIIIAVGIIANDASAARILGLFPHTGKSHQMVYDPLLQKLAERGHQVTVVSFFPLKDPPGNYTTVSLEGIADIGLETFNLNFPKSSNPIAEQLGVDNILEQMASFHVLSTMAINVCEKLVNLPILKDTLKQHYDVVLVEYFNSDCMLGLSHAYGLNAPKIGLSSCNMLPWMAERIGITDNPSYVPVISTSLTTSMTFSERLENTFMKIYFGLWYRYAVQVPEQKIIEQSLGKKIPDLQGIALNTSVIMTNVFHSLNGVRPTVPGLVEVGGMHLQQTSQPITQYIERFLNESEHGVILFSWGSLIKTSTVPAYKEEAIVRALNKFPQRVIWKYEDSGPEGNLTGNILRVSWLPQYELLQHKKVVAFIAHGGLLGMTEAISAGKPAVVVPFFGDQPNNAAFAENSGLGVVLKYAEITEETFYEAVKKVLTPEMQSRATKVSQIWHDRPMKPLDTAVYWVERVARWGYAAPLHLQARELPFYQKALLDVFACVILLIITLVLVTIFTSRLLIRAILSAFVKNKKQKAH